MAALMLQACIILAAVAGVTGVAGPFGVHAADQYDATFRQWDAVSSILEAYKSQQFGVSSSMGLRHLPHVSVHNVNMSDGILLSTIMINPYPYDAKKGTVIARSPYGPTSENLADIFVLGNGFAAVLQDDRGTFTSGGKYDMWQSAKADGLSTMQWVTSQPWSNGDVFMVGVSADGINEATAVLAEPPMLKGQWWTWTTANGYVFSYPGGAYRKDIIDGYMNAMNVNIHNASARVIEEVRTHEAYGPWWENITICEDDSHPLAAGCHWRQVKWPIMLLTGWWDLFQRGSIDAWNALRVASDRRVRDKHVHIISPLGHCVLSPWDIHPVLAAEEAVSIKTAAAVASEMFAGNFSGPTRSRIGRLNMFVMGGYDSPKVRNWNYWTSVDDWPRSKARVFYFQSGATLTSTAPKSAGAVEYVYDPHDPAPMYGGNNLPIWGFSKILHCGHADQSHREKRKDVIVFDSEPLSEDTPVVGAIRAKLFVSSSANDTDFVVTLSDLSPKGIFGLMQRSMLIRYGVQRMRWRHGDRTQSSHLSPGKVYEVDIELASTAYVFPKGHSIRVSVSSAANDYYNPNSNTGENMVTDKSPPVVAHNGVHFSHEFPSQMILPVVAIDAIPKNENFGVGNTPKLQTTFV